MSSRKIRFAEWVLDPVSGDLERAGVRTRLQEQPVLILKELIARAGEVLTRVRLIGVLGLIASNRARMLTGTVVNATARAALDR